MSELSDKYRQIMDEIDAKITDEKELEFVKSKLSEVSIIFIDIIDRLSEVINERVTDIEKGQKNIENKLAKVTYKNSMDTMSGHVDFTNTVTLELNEEKEYKIEGF